MLSKTDSYASRSPSLSHTRLPSDGELGMARWTLNWMSLVSQQLVCLRADRRDAAAGCRDTALDAYNGNDGSGILAASLSHTHFLSKMEMGRYFLLDFSKLAPLFGAFRVIRALFCCLSTRECVVPPRSSSSVIFGVDNDTAGSAERASARAALSICSTFCRHTLHFFASFDTYYVRTCRMDRRWQRKI